MTLKNNQIEPNPKVNNAQPTKPTTGGGKGTFYPKDVSGRVEGFYEDDTGVEIQLTEAGAVKGGGGGTSDHGALINREDDSKGHAIYHTDARGDARYFQKGEFKGSSAGGADSGKPVKLDGSGKLDSSMLPPSGAVQEFSFTLPAAADIAARIVIATGVPGGWNLYEGSHGNASAQFGGSPTTLVIEHSLTKIAQEISVLELTTSGPVVSQGYSKVDLTSPGVQQTETGKNQSGVIGLNSLILTTKDIVVFIKLI